MHQSTSAMTSLVDDHLLDPNTLSRTNHILQQFNVLMSCRKNYRCINCLFCIHEHKPHTYSNKMLSKKNLVNMTNYEKTDTSLIFAESQKA